MAKRIKCKPCPQRKRMVKTMGKRIILGDRKSLARMAYKGTLKAAGYEVLATFTTGTELTRLYHELKPDLVLSSAILAEPGGDVLTVVKMLLDSDPTATVLLYSHTSIRTEKECLETGAKGYFEYPARPDEMLAAVKKVIG